MNDATHAPCDCGALEEAAKEPDHPIGWDSELREYYLALGGDGRQPIYYCLFCGGRAPTSQREALFAHVTQAEEARLVALFAGLETVAEVRERLGEPDQVLEASVWYSSAGGDRPQHGEAFDRWIYERLSDVAEVSFEVRGDTVKRGYWIAKPLRDRGA